MSEAYIGEIRIFAGAYAPENWHICDGTILPISGNEALFSLLGTIYGGNGTSNFAIPDLRSLLVCGAGTGPASPTNLTIGTGYGAAAVALTTAQVPAHGHTLFATSADATVQSPTNNLFAKPTGSAHSYVNSGVAGFTTQATDPAMVQSDGYPSPQAHANQMRTIGLTYIICLLGTYPSTGDGNAYPASAGTNGNLTVGQISL